MGEFHHQPLGNYYPLRPPEGQGWRRGVLMSLCGLAFFSEGKLANISVWRGGHSVQELASGSSRSVWIHRSLRELGGIQTPGTDIVELVRDVRGAEDNLSSLSLDPGLADREERATLADDEDLAVAVDVPDRAAANLLGRIEQDRDVRSEGETLNMPLPEGRVRGPVAALEEAWLALSHQSCRWRSGAAG